MRAEAIFRPMSVLALWTGAVLLLTGLRRLLAVRRRRLSAQAFRLGESPAVPPELAVFNRNLMNLLEMPVLFYVVSLACYVTHAVDGTTLGLAWGFVALRLVHSAIHLTFNHVGARFAAFAASNLVLLAMWIRFMVRVAWGD
jgi:hypothetical protein